MSKSLSLICMRLADMHRVHPDQIESKCERCGEAVGIYPSGQSVLFRMGSDKVEIVCHVCKDKDQRPVINVMAPGAEKEVEQSVPRQKA